MTHARPYTPEMLADRWGCSSETVRTLIKRGELRGFRVGKLFRIPAQAVEEYECQTSTSGDCEGASVPTGTKTAGDGAIVLRHAPERKQRRRP